MIVKPNKYLWLTLGAFALTVGVCLAATAAVPATALSPDKIVSFIRERFSIPETTKLTADALRDSPFPDYYQTIVTVDDGKQKKTQSVFASKDGRYVVLGGLFPLAGRAHLAQHVREVFKLPATAEVTLSPVTKSVFPDFSQFVVTVKQGANKPQSQNFFITRDDRVMIAGNLYAWSNDPQRDALRTIITENQPSVGPARAPVTIVEYADLQCPSCARMHEFLEKQLLPKYGDKVRIVFKEFPLPFHDWSSTAAIANQCAYQISPSTFVDFRSRIFGSQSAINVANVRDQMLSLGEQAGVDRVKLAACIDSKASLPRVEKGVREGQLVGVTSTPTFFVNGKILAGMSPPDVFFKTVDEALAAAGPHAVSHVPPRRPQKAEVAKP